MPSLVIAYVNSNMSMFSSRVNLFPSMLVKLPINGFSKLNGLA